MGRPKGSTGGNRWNQDGRLAATQNEMLARNRGAELQRKLKPMLKKLEKFSPLEVAEHIQKMREETHAQKC